MTLIIVITNSQLFNKMCQDFQTQWTGIQKMTERETLKT